jgi:iron complex outermembrane receptor protein
MRAASPAQFFSGNPEFSWMTRPASARKMSRFRRSPFPSLARYSTCLLILLTAYSAAASAGPDPSGNALKELTLEQLGNVEVMSVSKQPKQVWKTAAAIYVITQDDIERSGVTTIPEALRLVPGVEVARIDSNRWSIGIRGFGGRFSRDVLVLIDGRSVYTTLLAGTYWETQNVMLEDVDRIEVIRGPGGTIWGPNAVNGVINVITKSSSETHGALASVGGGNVDQGAFNTRYGGGNGKGFNYRAYVFGFDRGPEFHPSAEQYDRWRAIQGGFRLDLAKNDRDTLTLQGDLYDEGAGERVNATTYAPPYTQILAKTGRLSGGNILGRWKRVLGEGQDLEVQTYYDRTNRHEPNFAETRDTFDFDFIHRFRLPARQQISWGFGARFSQADNPVVVSGLTFGPNKRTDQLITGFFQDEVALVPQRLSFLFGTKLLHTNYTGFQVQPTGRLLWTPNDKQTVWMAFTHAVRTPSAVERAFFLTGFIGVDPGTGLPFFARFNANPNFKSEQMNGYEIGYRQLLGTKLYFDLSAFYNHYGNLFSEDITGPTFVEEDPAPTHLLLPAQFGNGLRGSTRGIEIAPEWRPTSFWRLRASYSFLQMRIEKGRNSQDIGTGPFIEGSSPRHQVVVESGFDLTKVLSLDLAYRYVSELTRQSAPAYSTADAHFSWHATRNLQLSVSGRNLLQPHHFEAANDPPPAVGVKRSVYGKITWTR